MCTLTPYTFATIFHMSPTVPFNWSVVSQSITARHSSTRTSSDGISLNSISEKYRRILNSLEIQELNVISYFDLHKILKIWTYINIYVYTYIFCLFLFCEKLGIYVNFVCDKIPACDQIPRYRNHRSFFVILHT